MSEAKMTSKGQVTVPRAIRQKLRLKPGDRVRFIVEDDGRVRLLPANRDISELVGIVPKPERRYSLEEFDEAIRQHAAEKFARRDRN
jgi:AbrB family looped-hinge helix DNA binding protein